MQVLITAGAFLFGFCATYAGMKSLLALEARQPFRTANWGLLVNALSWSAVVLIVFTHSPSAILADLAGCWLADYLVTPKSSQTTRLPRKKDGRNGSSSSAALQRGRYQHPYP